MNYITTIFKKKSLVFALFFGLLALLPLGVQASHIIGGELTYRCLGNGEFEITLDVFRDCFYGEADFDSPAHIGIFNENGLAQTINLTPMSIDTLPNDLSDPCINVPDDVCVDWARYRTTVQLAPSATGHLIVYQRCCRNSTISNIVNPSETGATFFAKITPQGYTDCNSSPTFVTDDFLNYPPVAICVGKPINFDHSATDIDGDSLAYKLCTPFVGASFAVPQPPVPSAPPYTNLAWTAPYSLANLLGDGADPLAIDAETGLLTGFPPTLGQFVVGICVEEYRNGELLSTVRRDFQYNVTVCSEVIANAEFPTAQCDDLTVEFENTSEDTNNFLWYFEDDEQNVGVSTVDNPTFTFPDTGTYLITLVAAPNTQCVDTFQQEIYLQFNSIEAGFNIITYDCEDSTVLVLQNITTDPVSPIVSYNWTLIANNMTQTSTENSPTFLIPNPSTGVVTMTAISQNGCETTVSQNFQTAENNPLNMIELDISPCFGETIGLNPALAGDGIFSFNWGTPINSNATNPMIEILVDGLYPVTISAPGGLCMSEAELTVTVIPLPELAFETMSDCDGLTVTFTNLSTNAADYIWNFGDGSPTENTVNPIHIYENTDDYTVTLTTGSTTQCTQSVSEVVALPEKLLAANFDFEYSECQADEIAIDFTNTSINSLNNTTQYDWQFENNGSSTVQNPTLILTNEQTLDVTLTITTAEGCVSSVIQNLMVDFIEFDFTDSLQICHNEPTELNPNGNPNYTYLWTPDTGLDDNTKPNPIAKPQNNITYTVFITNISADTCELSQQIKVTVPEPIGLQVSNDIETCDENVTLTATTNIDMVDFSWVNNTTGLPTGNMSTLDVIVSGIDTYTVTVQDDFGCEETATIPVTGGPVNFDLTDNIIKCTNEAVDIELTNLDPNDSLTIVWAPTSAFQGDPTNDPTPDLIITPSEQTIYATIINQFGCLLTDSVYIALVDENINLDFDFQIGCSGSTVEFTNLSTNAYNYVWSFGTGDTSTEENPTYSFGIGLYNVTLSIGFDVDCVEEITKQINILAPDFIPGFEFEYVTCETDAIQIQFTDTSFNFLNNTNSWEWVFSNGMTSNEQNPLITITEDTDLTVTVTIGTPNDCEGSTTQQLNVDLIEENLITPVTLCFGDIIALNPNGDTSYEYNWTPVEGLDDPTAANPMAFPTETTTYSVTILNENGADVCSITRTVMIEVPEKIEVTALGDSTTCGTAIILNAVSNLDPDINFQWFTLGGNPLSVESQLAVSPVNVSSFILEGRDADNCFDRDTITISNEEIDIEITFKGESCPDDTLNLSASNNITDHILNISWEALPPAQILSDNTGPNVTVITAAAGIESQFVITSANQFNCERIDTITIFSHDFEPTVVDEILVCPNVETNINPGANPALDYFWLSPNAMPQNAPNPMVNIEETETFTVIVSENFGTEFCTVTEEILVNVPPVINIDVAIDTFTCGAPITVCATTNVPVTSLQWLDMDGNILEATDCIEVNPDSSITLIVQAIDAENCSQRDTIVVTNEQVDISLQGDGEIMTCPQDSFQVCVENLDFSDFLTYEWTADANGTITSGGATNCPWITTIPNTLAVFTVTATNQFGCMVTETISVETYEFDAAVVDTVYVCAGIPTAINPTANFDLTYEWIGSDDLDDTTSPNPTITTNITTILTAFFFGVNGVDTCFAALQVAVIVNPLMMLQAEPAALNICESDPVTLTAESDTSADFTWSNNPDFSNPISMNASTIVNPIGAVTYYLLAIDDLGCRDSVSVLINAFPIDIEMADEVNICEEIGSVEIGVLNNDDLQNLTYTWSPAENIIGNTVNSNPVDLTVDEDMWVYVNVMNQFGCEIVDSTWVNYFDLNGIITDISATPDTIQLGSDEMSQLMVPQDDSFFYEWSPAGSLDNENIANPIAQPEETTTYNVLISNEDGCATERDIEVFVKNLDCDYPFVFVPSAFSPNGDNENDEFLVRGVNIEEMNITIFNRWGQKVFETNNQEEGWGGTFKGELLAPDVYGYYLTVKCFNGKENFKKGNVSLLR
ncbi:MAG: gliding motility-associated-like protein [Paraglaciecola sp.]|jgi:gliding motility-associated-like protein